MSMEQEYRLEFFAKNRFQRRTCPTCASPFWTQDPKREICGDPPCAEYTFIGAPVTKQPYGLREMREKFLSFFEEKDHSRVKRYPVVARWRDDIYLTIASIADFQPHVTAGLVPPPANPLTISQPCIRLNDLDSVGRSGRHLTTFEMMAHHAFNYPEQKTYFKERCTELCHEFLTKRLGIASELITYKEKPWAGGGNAGAAFEVLVAGLEVATLVFMDLEAHPDGEIELYGERYRKMAMAIVDTGYGLERLVWASKGSPTIYDAVLPEIVAEIVRAAGLEDRLRSPHLKKVFEETARLAALMDVGTGTKLLELRKRVHERLVARGVGISFEELVALQEPLERVYAIADHTRCLAFMFGDGVVPSNVKAGYLSRLVLRRTVRLMDELGVKVHLRDIIARQLDFLAQDFPELKANRDTIFTEVDLEVERYRETVEKGTRLVQREAQKLRGKAIGLEALVEFYDVHGLSPDIVKAVAEPLGVVVDVPDDFYSAVAGKHSKAKPEERGYDAPLPATRDGKKGIRDLPPTKLLYYEDSTLQGFDAVVLWAKDGEVVLNQTAFYPEGGGQPSDGGTLVAEDDVCKVVDAQKLQGANGPVVVHRIDGKLKVGAMVRGRVDWGRRLSHTRHHTATHIMLGAARRVLGPHVWQAGAQKGADRSRVDVQHYRRISDEELREMEQLVNVVVMEDLPVDKTWMPRDEAERRYGFQLYQGGVPPGRDIRVVRIQDFDVEACAGTHVRSTSEVGPVKIVRTERVQDGIERIEFTAGLAAVKHIQKREQLLREASEALSVPAEELPKTAARFFEEWKELRKRVDDLTARLAHAEAASFVADGEFTVQGAKVALAVREGLSGTALRETAMQAALKSPGGFVAVVSTTGEFVIARGPGSSGDAGAVAKVVAGGAAGGKPELAQGRVKEISGVPKADALAFLRKRLGG